MKGKYFILSVVLVMLGIQSCSDSLDRGLVLHSSFEEDASDSGPNHYDGSLVGGAVISDDAAVGKGSVYLNGDGAYVEYPAGNVYFEGDYSVSIWVKWDECHVWDRILDFNQAEPKGGNAVTWLVGRPAQGTENNMWLDQWVLHEDIAVESILDQRARPADAYLGYNIHLGQWEHYVIVYDSSAENPYGTQVNTMGQNVPLQGKVTLYVNGVKAGENTHCLKPQHAVTVANWLGRSRFAPDPFFKGWMDDFRIYDRQLTEAEVKTLYKKH